MGEQAITTLGGVCRIFGVVVVVWDLFVIAVYRGAVRRAAVWLRARWAMVAAAVRRVLRRPRRTVVRTVGLAGEIELARTATGRVSLGPFVAQPGQALDDQVAALARLVNWLREDVINEPQERERVITAEREARREELRAEAARLERLIAGVRQEVEDLREATTGGARLHWEGVPVVLAGIAFTTWPGWWAERWPEWLTALVLALGVAYYLAGRLCWAIETRLRRAKSPSRTEAPTRLSA